MVSIDSTRSSGTGKLDFLVNNAGWTTSRCRIDELDDLTDEIFRKTFDVNVFGTWWLTKRAIPHLRQSPTIANIVNITSIAGCAASGVVDGVLDDQGGAQPDDAVAREERTDPIRVNAVAPGPGGDPVDRGLGTRCTRLMLASSRRCHARRRPTTAPRRGAGAPAQQVHVGRDFHRRRVA